MDFYERIKELVKENNTTIESVANFAGLSLNSYNSYKRHGNLPRADEAVKMAKFLNTSVEYLVTGENPPAIIEKSIDHTQTIELLKKAIENLK